MDRACLTRPFPLGSRCLPLCPSLVSLDLAANPGITVVGLRMLLSALGERNQGLHYLSLAGEGVKGSEIPGSPRDLVKGPAAWP